MSVGVPFDPNAEFGADLDTVGSIGPNYTLLAENCVCGDPAIAAGTFGAGVVVFDTTNFSVDTFDPPGAPALGALFLHLGDSTRVPARMVSLGAMKARFR